MGLVVICKAVYCLGPPYLSDRLSLRTFAVRSDGDGLLWISLGQALGESLLCCCSPAFECLPQGMPAWLHLCIPLVGSLKYFSSSGLLILIVDFVDYICVLMFLDFIVFLFILDFLLLSFCFYE